MRVVMKKGITFKQWTWGAAMAAVAWGAPMYASAEEGMMEGLKGVTVNGYVEGQYNYNFNDPADNPATGAVDEGQVNAFRVFDGRANSFTFNMAEVSMTKAAGETPGFGLVVNYGLDTQLTASSPFFGTPSDIDVQQAYVADKVLGDAMELKFGKFATLAGAEVIEGPLNFNISRAYLFGFAIPFTHTGLRVAYTTPIPGMTVTAGVNNGWDAASDGDKGKTAELQVALAPMDMLSLGVTGYYGPESSFSGTDARSVVDVLATIKPMDGLTVVLNYDRGTQDDASAAGSALWQGYALYANLGLGEKHAVTLRAENFDDQDGFRTGTVQTLRELTLTLACKMKENLEWRAELRHDESNQDVFVDDKGDPQDTQNTVAVAAYYTF